MARRGENIYHRRDGRYEGRYVTGKTRKGTTKFGYVYAHSYAEVRRVLIRKKAECQAHCGAGEHYSMEPLESYMRRWMENELYGSLKRSSWQTYKNQMEAHVLPALGGVPLSGLTPCRIHSFLDELEQKGLAGSTIRGILRLLSACLRFAQEEGLIPRNPCRRIRVQTGERAAQRVLTRQEQELLCSACQSAEDLPMLFGVYTGMRLGEICALKWKDINWDEKTITVQRTVQRVPCRAADARTGKTFLFVGAPKSAHSCRTLPLPEPIALRLKSLERRPGAEYLFGNGSRAIDPRTVQRHFQRKTKFLKIGGVHFHTLRHSFATRLLELGVDIKTVSVLLGHSNARITLDYYAHSLTEQQRRAVDRLADLVA